MTESNGLDLARMPDQAIGVITAPREFFKSMPRDGGYLDPIVFLLVMGIAATLIQIVLGFIGFGQGAFTGMAMAGLFTIIILPLFLLVASFIIAAVAFVIWRFLGSQQTFETAYRCTAYMSAIAPIAALLGAIPYLGTIAHVAWGTVLMIIASVEVHVLKERTAQIVFGIIGAIMALLGISNEYAARNMQQHFDQMSRQLSNDFGNQTPEQLGQSVGEFMKGIQNATRQSEEASQ
jgi:hypothetical protein